MSGGDDITEEVIAVGSDIARMVVKHGRDNNIDVVCLVRAMAMAGVQVSYGLSVEGQELTAIKLHREFTNYLSDNAAEKVVEHAGKCGPLEFVDKDS